jgi:AhpD family alkylhydroperoxidase
MDAPQRHVALLDAAVLLTVAGPTSRSCNNHKAQEETMSMFDMANMKKLKSLGAKAPDTWKAYRAFGEAALADGAIPKKYKELMAVAVSLTTQCPYCIEIHKEEALKAGATEVELAETTFVAAALRAGASITHGTHVISA